MYKPKWPINLNKSYIHSSKQIHPSVAWQTAGVVNNDEHNCHDGSRWCKWTSFEADAHTCNHFAWLQWENYYCSKWDGMV